MKIALQAVASAVFGLVFFGLLLFGPAGTLNYWQAWVFIAVFVVVTSVGSLLLALENPEALQRRMRAGPAAETRTVQKIVITGTIVSVVAVLVISSLDHRFGWSQVPTPVVVAGDVLVGLGLAIAMLVVIQNAYAAATVRVEDGQQLVSTGLYGVVRHPMYFGTLIMMVGTPLSLGSYWALLVIIPAIPVFAARLLDEEKMLREELAGYDAYTDRVRYRLLPGVW